MDEPLYDIAMKFVLQGGGDVLAESTLDVDPGDPLMKDFSPIDDYADYSNFFEVKSFDFAMNVEPEDAGSGQLSRPAAGQRPGVSPRPGIPASPLAAQKPGGATKPGANDPFHRWRSATEDQARLMRFDLTFDSFRFDRVIDGASPTFFHYCSRQLTFDSAALVKRVSLGNPNLKQRSSQAFMRIDFTKVTLKGVKWSDGNLVTEHCEFVCDGLTFQYRQQRADGTLMPVQDQAVWDRAKDTKRKEETR